MKMKRLVTTLAGTTIGRILATAASLGLGVCSASPAAAESLVCGTAVLSDVEVVSARVPQSTMTVVHTKPNNRKKPGEREIDAYTTPAERQTKTYRVTVRLNDLVYTGQSSGNWYWDFDPTRLVINDPVAACVSRDTLRIRRPDGKEYKSKIVRVIREVANEPTQEGSDK